MICEAGDVILPSKEAMFWSCSFVFLSFCLTVCQQDYLQTNELIWMKLLPEVCLGGIIPNTMIKSWNEYYNHKLFCLQYFFWKKYPLSFAPSPWIFIVKFPTHRLLAIRNVLQINQCNDWSIEIFHLSLKWKKSVERFIKSYSGKNENSFYRCSVAKTKLGWYRDGGRTL